MTETVTRKGEKAEADLRDSKKMRVKAVFRNGALRPVQELNLGEGEEVEIEITKKRGRIFGALKNWKVDSQKLKDELRSIHD